MKRCCTCKLDKPLDRFGKDRSKKDGLQVQCKDCNKTYRDANKERAAQYSKRYHAENFDLVSAHKRKHYETNIESIRENRRAYFAANRSAFNARFAKRRAAQRQAIPGWADQTKIALAYEEAQFATEFFGVPFHVDHIIPIKGVFRGKHVVCGLHWEGNLQVLSSAENLRKKNIWWPDGPMCN